MCVGKNHEKSIKLLLFWSQRVFSFVGRGVILVKERHSIETGTMMAKNHQLLRKK